DVGSALVINGGQPGSPNPSIYNDGDNGATSVQIQSATSTNGNTILNLLGGNVGIGTSSPQYKLDVNGGVRLTGLVMPTGAVTGYVLTSDVNGVGTWQAPTWSTLSNGNLTLTNGGSTALQISPAGIMRIGSTTPSNYPGYSLSVAGLIVSQQSAVTAVSNWSDFV